MKKVVITLLITFGLLAVLVPICMAMAWTVYHFVSWFLLTFGMLAFTALVPTLFLIVFFYGLVKMMLEDKHEGWWN